MNKIRLTAAQAMIRFLNNQYFSVNDVEHKFIKGFWTIFGHGNVLGIGQALIEEKHDFIVHKGCNEQGMALAATGFAKQKNRTQIYACTSSIGPGSANFVTAAATATANRIPLLLIAGDIYASRQPDPVLQQIEQEYNPTISTNDSLKSVCKYWDRITRPEMIMSSLINALRVLTDPANTGAVAICFPQDVQGEAYDYPIEFFKKRIYKIPRILPDNHSLQNAIKVIEKAKKPLIICGGGVKYSHANDQLLEFSQTYKIPIAETQAGKSAILSNYELNLGGIGVTGTSCANKIANQADLIIGIGTKYTDFTTGSKSIFKNPDCKFINININNYDSYKLDAIKLNGDAKTILKYLIKELKNTNIKFEIEEKAKQEISKWELELDRLLNIKQDPENFEPEVYIEDKQPLKDNYQLTKSLLCQTTVIGIINKNIEKDSVIITASGSLPSDLQRIWLSQSINNYHAEYGYSCMGYEVNAALGTKIAVGEDKEVYALVGDGSFMMLHSELLTSIQENQKINIVLLDNMSFGCINNLQMGAGLPSYLTENRKRTANGLTGELIPVNFAQIASGYGCKTYQVYNEQQLIDALNDTKLQNKSTLIDIKVLPKTMTSHYDVFWNTCAVEQSENTNVMEYANQVLENRKIIKQY